MPQVIVKPLEKKTWHGKAGKESFSASKVVEAFYSSEVGGYATGLTPEEEKVYGDKLGVRLDNKFNMEEPHPFWGSKAGSFSLPNAMQTFDTGKARDFVKVKLMKVSPLVANSMKEYDEGKWPRATHYIFDEQEEAALEAGILAKTQNATVAAMQMSTDSKVSLLMLLIGKNYRGKSDDIINVEIAKVIADADRIDEFLRFYNLGVAEVTLRAQVEEMIQRNILNRDGTAIYYMSDQIGYDFDAAVQYLQEPNNQRLKLVLLERLQKIQA